LKQKEESENRTKFMQKKYGKSSGAKKSALALS